MKSFCIKTNNKKILASFLKELETFPLENVYFLSKEFRIYNNIIIHYLGDDLPKFLNLLSDIITNCILYYYEPVLIRRNINYNYFYFDEIEKNIIENSCSHCIENDNEHNYRHRKNEIKASVLEYIKTNKSMILDGFVNFRLEKYNSILEELVDFNVKQYVIQKEYNELIELLQIYINSKPSICNLLHLIYINGNSIILDENKNIINLTDKSFDMKYLSDISFSSNDYALNALLTLLPKKIEIHLIDFKDEFIDTLQLIFTTRISICTNCNICKTYKILNNNPVLGDSL